MTIRNINPALFIAAARFVSTEETRYYLKGVLVQRAKGGGLLYTSTDGHRLFHAHDANAEMSGDARIIGIAKPKFSAAWLKSDHLTWENGVLSSDDKTLLFPAAEVDGTFPDYTRIIPSTSSGETAHFNYTYLADYQEAAKKCALGTMFVHHNGQNPSLITFSEAPAIAVLMPVRTDMVCSDRPVLPHAS